MTSLKLAALGRVHPPMQAARWLGLMVGLVMMAFMSLMASSARAADEVPDPPDRVGRLSDLAGQVWIYAPESSEWIAASRNRPVTTGDRLSTEGNGRAEVRIGSTVLRVDGNTELEVLQLDDQRIGLQLHSGSVTARLRTREAADQFGLSTDEGHFRTEKSGNYRFDRVDGTSSATVLSGQLQFESEGTALAVQPGQRAEFWKEGGRPQYSMTDPKRDGFSDWVASRDRREDRSASSRYVSPEMTGVEDLDRYGHWDDTPDYGAVWIPRDVAPGWAPYRVGHWTWISPWGWTWVDDAPWGFAPFHYGRWVSYRGAWCWTPGRFVARPVYSPALVAWVGGPAVNVSVSIGGPPTVGWFPLGPREIFVPNYHVSPRYVREVNVTHVTNINVVNVTNIINNPNQYVSHATYVNRGIPNAVTVVPVGVMEHRQPVAPAMRNFDERQWRDIARQSPRVDAPVAAPPHAAPGLRRIEDPRTGRENLVTTPGGPQNERVPPSPRWQHGGDDGNRHNANGSGSVANAPGQAPAMERPPSHVTVAPAQAAPQPQGIWAPERGRPSAAPVTGAAPAATPTPPADRAPAAQQREGRARNHEMPGPPRQETQAPAPQAPPPRPQVQAPQSPAPQANHVAEPPRRDVQAEQQRQNAAAQEQRQRAAEEQRQRAAQEQQRAAAEERAREREGRAGREDRGEREGRSRAQ